MPDSPIPYLSWVRVKLDLWDTYFMSLGTNNNRFIYLGEIPNMPWHCVVVSNAGKVIIGYHTSNFEVLPKEEI